MDRKKVRQIVLTKLHEHQVDQQNPQAHIEPRIWQEIFTLVFGSDSAGTEDSRWDQLFCPREGYRALHYVRLFDRLAKG